MYKYDIESYSVQWFNEKNLQNLTISSMEAHVQTELNLNFLALTVGLPRPGGIC